MGISVGLVGLGEFGSHFMSLYKAHPNVERLALCDLNRDRLENYAKKYEISETYPSLDAICKSDIEALVIITQQWLHARQAIQAMKAGKHVYTAVPAAQSIEECNALVKTVKQTGMIYMNGETTYFRPETAFCRKKAEEGAFGEFVHCRAEYFHDMRHGLYDVAKTRWGNQFGKDKTGEPPMHYPTHSISFPVSVMKAHMVEVSAQGFVYPNDDWFREDTIYKNIFSNESALFKMSNGATAEICEFRRVSHCGHEGVVGIYGTEGSFEKAGPWSEWNREWTWYQWNQQKGHHEVITVKVQDHHGWLPEPLASSLGGHGGSHAYLVHEFVDSVNRQRLPRINVWEAVRYCAPGFVAHQSVLLGGKLLKIPDWGDPLESYP